MFVNTENILNVHKMPSAVYDYQHNAYFNRIIVAGILKLFSASVVQFDMLFSLV